MFLRVENLQGSVNQLSELQIVGNYSVDGEQCYCNDISQLKYYKKPKNLENIRFDLNDNKHTIHKFEGNMKLDFMLYWLLENFNKLKTPQSEDVNSRWLEPELICFRGVLTTLFNTPYDTEDGWIICASKFKGTIYLCGFDTIAKENKQKSMTAYEKRCSAWGHKFEQYLVTDKHSGKPNLSVPLNQNEEFCCVFKMIFGNTTLLYGAEIDAVSSEHKITNTLVDKNVELIELKTLNSKALTHDGKIIDTRAPRTLKWWLQCHLVGIKRIICGCRTSNGIVHKIKEFTLDTLQNDFKNQWSFERCSSFCTAFLERLKVVVSQDYDKCLYKFTYYPNKRTIGVERLKPSPELSYMFLHNWYIIEANKKFSGS